MGTNVMSSLPTCIYNTMESMVRYTLQMHCPENSKQISPNMKLRGFIPNFYIHVSVSDLYIHDPSQQQYSKFGGSIVII
jgi:hypothetical protein